MKHVWMAIPCYTGQIHMGTFRSIVGEMLVLSDAGVKIEVHDESGNAMIAHGRDLFCAKFLASAATDLIFIDHDLQWTPGAILKLLGHPVDVVAGIYPKRSDPLGFHCRFIAEREELRGGDEPGTEKLLEVEGVPAGFMRISRRCLEQMVLKYPEKRFADKYAPKGFAWALFDNIHEGDVYFGEDYSFCRRWRQIGGKVWADPEIPLGHIGNKTFYGTFGDWLRDRP
jgi:hypothetical protein